MKRQSQKAFALVSRSGIALSIFLLSVGVGSAQPTRGASELTVAQALSSGEREELEQLRSERRTQAQAQAEVSSTLR